MARTGSFPYYVILAVVAFLVLSLLANVFDTVLEPILSHHTWTTSEYAHTQEGRNYLQTMWEWRWLYLLTGIGTSLYIAARRGA